MLRVVLRKMFRNKWMMLCLLIGSVISVAMLSSIPMYTDGVLQRMLTKDLEDYQQKTKIFPGHFSVQIALDRGSDEKTRASDISIFNNKINAMAEEYKLPILTKYVRNTVDFLSLEYGANDAEARKSSQAVKIQAMSDLENHITLISGRMYTSESPNEVYEVLVTEEAYEKLNLMIDREYITRDIVNKEKTIKIKVVGVFTIKESSDNYWPQGLMQINDSLMMNYDAFNRSIFKTGSILLEVPIV